MISIFIHTYFFSLIKCYKMKISKSLIQAIAVAVAVGAVTTACTKQEPLNPDGTEIKKNDTYNCPGCGMG